MRVICMQLLRKPLFLLLLISGMLFCIPLLAWVLHWQWHANAQSSLLWGFYLFTQTVSRPFGYITSLVLLIMMFYSLGIPRIQWGKFALALLLPVIIGQLAINVIKQHNQEPRPYVVWLSQTDRQADQHFYQLDVAQRQQLIKRDLASNGAIPAWQQQHWLAQTDPAFPSGHTIFAATWALMAVSLLLARGKWLLSTVIVLWAAGVIISRLALGMHWPGDVFVSIMLALYLSMPSVYWLRGGFTGD